MFRFLNKGHHRIDGRGKKKKLYKAHRILVKAKFAAQKKEVEKRD